MSTTEKKHDTPLPIRKVAQRTGVNPVTLRAWERRYGLLVPDRTGKGHRQYSERDIQRIEEILGWLARGVGIGKVRPLMESGVEVQEGEDGWGRVVQQTAMAIECFAERDLQRQLEQLLDRYPLSLLSDRWLAPLHGKLCRRNRFGSSVAHGFFWQWMAEYLASNIRASRKNLQQAGGGAHKRILLVGFAGSDQRVFAQLFSGALLENGFDVLDLGPELELSELAFAEEKFAVQGIVCYSHNALPMAVFGSGLERARRGMRTPLWFAGGFVDLQHRDLQQLARRINGSLLPGECTGALQQLREHLR